VTDEAPPARHVGRLTYLVFAAATLLALWLLADILLIVFAAILVAVAYRGSAAGLANMTRLPIGAALAIVGFGFVAAVVLAAWWGGSGLAEQGGQLWTQLEAEARSVRRYLENTVWGNRILQDLGDERFLGGLDTLAGRFAGAALTTFGIVGSIFIVLITAIYFAVQPETYKRGFLMLVPVERRQRGAEVLDAIGETLRYWLIGRAIEMVAVGLMAYLGLMMLGVPLALMLAIIAGVLNFIPYIGAIAGALPAILVALGQGPMMALWVGLLFVVIQSIESYLLYPYIQQRTVHLPAALTILSQTVFGTLFGVLGLLLASALAAVLLALIKMIYVHDFLGDRDSAPE
jgi:predicted PurR-regulated permease PerM